MANDPIIEQSKLVRGVDAAGTVHNLLTDTSGRLISSGAASSTTAAITTVAVSTAAAVVAAANTARKGLIIQNEGGQAALVSYSTTATTTAYTVSIPSSGYWEMPPPVYNLGISVVSVSSTATLRVTEF